MNARIAFCILILGATSAVAGYAGLNISFPHDSLWMKLFAALIAAAIGVAVATFWHIAFQVVLKVIQRRLQFLSWAVVIVGCLAITGMSAAWHVAAIGGDAALTAAIYETLDDGEAALSDAARSRNGYRGFQSRLSGFHDEVVSLAACEDATGCITGTPGKQGVYGTLIGMQGKIDGIIKALAEDDRLSDTRLAEGRQCLADFRAALSSGKAGGERGVAASSAFDCVNVAVAAIDGNGQLERIAQEMDSLTAGLVLPVSVKTAAQKQAVENILASLRERASSIAANARKVAAPATIGTISLERMSVMKAVIIYWDEIIPAWVTGIALDLIPVLFLAFEAIRVASSGALPDADTEISITEAIVNASVDTSTAEGEFIFTVLTAQARLERRHISRRTKEGLAATRQRGTRLGRPPKLSDDQLSAARRQIEGKSATIGAIAAQYKVDPWTLTRSLRRHSPVQA